MPYCVDFARLHAIHGSRDKTLLAAVEAFVGPPVEEPPKDRWPLDVMPPEAYVDVREAVRRVIYGGVWGPQHEPRVRGSMVFFYKDICGEAVVGYAYRNATGLLAAADRALETRAPGHRGLFTQLFTGGVPAGMMAEALPAPRYGHLQAETVVVLRQLLADHDFSECPLQIRGLIAKVAEAASHRMGLMGELEMSNDRGTAVLYRMHFERAPKTDVVGAARDLLEGRPRLTRYGDAYVTALQVLCAAMGRLLANDAVAPAGPDHLELVDRALEAQGVGGLVSLATLSRGGAPFSLPESDDLHSVGHMTPDAVRAARGALASRDWSAYHDSVQRTIAQIDGWIEEAAASGHGLVAFYA